MRINLPKHNCVHFAVTAEWKSREDADKISAIMNRTATQAHSHDEEELEMAIFGSRMRIGGVTHRVQGTLHPSFGTNDPGSFGMLITYDRADETLRRPPTTVKPVLALVNSLSEIRSTADVSCYATFSYQFAAGLSSRVRFPVPLIVSDVEGGVTHLERAEFSRRVDDEVVFRVSVTEDDDSFVHAVTFDTKTLLDRGSITRLFRQARMISSQMVLRTDGDDDASS